MDAIETETLRLLKNLGFTNIKILGRSGDRVEYTSTDGEPLLDAPTARVVDGTVKLEAWTP